jgi:hypothetical protein
MKELLDIATRHAYGEEAVEIVFIQAEGHYPKQLTKAQRGVPKATRGGEAKRQTQWVTVTTSCNEGNNNKEADDSDEELIAAAERDFKRQAR